MQVEIARDHATHTCPFTSGDGACNLLVWVVNHAERPPRSDVTCSREPEAPDRCPLRGGDVVVRLT